MSVEHVWAGATTTTAVWVRGKVTGSSTRLAIDTDPALSDPTFFGPDTPTADGIVSLRATGLDPDTRYHYALEDDDVIDTDFIGTFLTHPVEIGERSDYIFGVAGDAGLTGTGDDSFITSEVSNNPVFDTMRAQAGSEDWLWFSHLGDLHYRNINSADSSLYRAAYDDVLTFNETLAEEARQGKFYRDVALTYIWDDHDFGPNNSDRTDPGNADANAVYRERVPHYPLQSDGIYQSWQVGRVLYVALDSRTFRDPNSDDQLPSKMMLGSDQKAWLEALLVSARNSSGAEALVFQTSSRWRGGSDSWSSFMHERDELVQMFGDTGWLRRMILLTADEHALGISSGPGNPHGGFPMFMMASMDSSFTTASDGTTDIYNLFRKGGRQQYGTIEVFDDGHTIQLKGTGYVDGSEVTSHSKYVQVSGRVISLDYSAAEISESFEPEDDDQGARNIVTATREGGGEFTFSVDEGPESTQDPPDGAGEYDESVTLAVATDQQLPNQAAWRARLGTVDEDRYPSITVDLRGSPDLAEEMSTANIGDVIEIENPPPEIPPETIRQVIEGGKTSVSLERWQVETNTSPGSPWTVAKLAKPQVLSHNTFEVDLEGFTGQGGATLDRVASPGDPPFDTEFSVEITPDGVTSSGGARGVLTGVGTVVPGEDYIVYCWAYSPGGWTDLRPVIDWFDDGGSFVFTGLGVGTDVPAGQWTLISQTFTAPVTSSQARARARHGSTPDVTDIWYADEITIRELRATDLSAGPNSPNRADTSGSELAGAVDDVDTEMIIHTPQDGVHERKIWIASNGSSAADNLRPLQFPFDLRIGGEIVRATDAESIAWDQFDDRNETDTWGDADSDQTWSEVGGAATDRSVNGSEGIITLTDPSSTIRFQQILEDVADTEVLVRMAAQQVSTGASIIPGILLRASGSDYYRARLHFSTGGDMFVSVASRTDTISTESIPYTYSSGDWFWVRARVIGHRVLIRAWPETADSEPQVWHEDVVVDTNTSDSGAIGVTCSAFADNDNVDPEIHYDDFRVITPQRFTVTRSINTVEKSHAAGDSISLAQPARLPL